MYIHIVVPIGSSAGGLYGSARADSSNNFLAIAITFTNNNSHAIFTIAIKFNSNSYNNSYEVNTSSYNHSY